ncbi:MAG: transglutaminase family protein [Opitutales bacterium]|jgi:transglutaminase-like putative cysteine protease
MRLKVYHRTEYSYSESVRNNSNEVKLTPVSTRWQSCLSSFIRVLPAVQLRHYIDLNNNLVHLFDVLDPHDRLVIDSYIELETLSRVSYEKLPYGFLHANLDRCRLMDDCHPFLQNSHLVEITPEAWRQALDIQGDSKDVFQTTYAIMEHIHSEYTYQAGVTNVSTTASEVLIKREGVCQDFAHAMVAMCRSIGIPARYVSGYFFDASRGLHARGSEASHAWVDVYIDGHGWIGLDPTNNKVVDDTYITLAIGRDYMDVAPVKGSYIGAARSLMSVTLQVEKLN